MQAVERGGGRGRSFTIVWPDGAVHEAADRFLRGYEGSGTQRTYAYLLLDHLRWLEREALAPETVLLQDLRRYMAALGAAWRGPYGQPWRAGRRPFGQSALSAAAACVKGFYLQQALLGVNPGSARSCSWPGCRRGPTGSGRSWATCSGSCRPTRWPRPGSGAGIRSCRPRAPGRSCWRRWARPGTGWW